MSDREGVGERFDRERDDLSRAVWMDAFVAQLFGLTMLMGLGWFLLALVLGKADLAPGEQAWIRTVWRALIILLPISYLCSAWFIFRRWKPS